MSEKLLNQISDQNAKNLSKFLLDKLHRAEIK